MLTLKHSIFLICLTVRFSLAYFSYVLPSVKVRQLSYLALLPIIGWLNIIFFSPRDSGIEVPNGKIWWQNMRPVHVLMYIIFFLLAQFKTNLAWIPLFIDPLIGIGAWINNYI